MKLSYMSLRWYISLLFGLLVVAGWLAFTWHSVYSMKEEQRSEIQWRHEAIGNHFNQLLNTQTKKLSDMTVIFPLVPFSHVSIDNKSNLKNYENIMRQVWEDIEIFWGIDKMYLVDERAEIVLNSSPGEPVEFKSWLEFSNLAQPVSRLSCPLNQECLLYYAMPIAGLTGFQGYLIFAESLHEIFQDLSSTQQVQIGLLQVESLKNPKLLHQVGMNEDFIQWVSAKAPLVEALKKGVTVLGKNSEQYELGVITLPFDVSGELRLLWARNRHLDDVVMRDYVIQTIFIGGILLLLTIWFAYLAISPVTNRLTQLSELLPKLAGSTPEKMLAIVDELKARSSRMPKTELDIVAAASRRLMLRLAATAKEVVHRTAELESMAMTDALTGLPNRNMLRYELELSLRELDRQGQYLGICMLDVDDFKLVNDSLGHDEGDVLIQQLGQRLRTNVRDCDSVFRLGGDEFVVLFRHLPDPSDMHESLTRLMSAFQEPLLLSTRPFNVAVSIGVVTVSQFQMQEEILKRADMAMYKAKQTSGCSYEMFDEGLSKEANERLQVISAVPHAIDNDEFCLYLQPQIRFENREVMGFESLIRWQDPNRGLVMPDAFIPHLERSHYMIDLGYWVLKASVNILNQIHEKGFSDISIAVNLSPQQFNDSQLIPFIEDLVCGQKFPPSCLHVEITESSVMRDIESAVDIVSGLRKLGVKVAMDDFGTGHSSLGHLQNLPLDIIKVDRSFVSGMIDNALNRQIVKSTIEIASVMDIEVIAEGVEDGDEESALRDLDCGIGQGYFYARPMSVTDAMSWLGKLRSNEGKPNLAS